MITKFAFLLVPSLLVAQPAFEAASIKPADPRANGFFTQSSRTQIELHNCSLLQCIETAWGLPDYAVSGPAWLESVRFDVIAKFPAGASPKDTGPMLQTLLAERFQLKTHSETREVPGYVLTVAKGGPKLHESAPDAIAGTGYGATMVQCRTCAMPAFLAQLTRSVGRPVSDQTALTGTYDFNLRWTADAPPSAAGEAPTPGPSLLNVFEEQLGLKLQAGRIPTTVLIVDSANRAPTGN